MEKQNSKKGQGEAQSLPFVSAIHQGQEELPGSAFCFSPA